MLSLAFDEKIFCLSSSKMIYRFANKMLATNLCMMYNYRACAKSLAYDFTGGPLQTALEPELQERLGGKEEHQ